jgi:hypothetical protein
MMPVRVTPRDHSLLLDLKDHGAALAEDLRCWFPSSSALRMRLLQLGSDGYVEVVGHHEGQRIFALAPRGKRYLGVRSNWRTRPQEALRQVVWRRCHSQLVGEGYRRVAPWNGGLALYRKASGPALAVKVFTAGASARYLRALFARHYLALIGEGALLCVFSPQAQPLETSSIRCSSVLLRTLPAWRSDRERLEITRRSPCREGETPTRVD